MPMSCELLAPSPAASCSGTHLSILWLSLGHSACTWPVGTHISQLLFFIPWLMISSSLGSTSSLPAWNHVLLCKLLHCCFSSEQASLEKDLHSHPLAALHPLSQPKRLWWLLVAPFCLEGWSVSKVWSHFSMLLEPLPSLPKLTAGLFSETSSNPWPEALDLLLFWWNPFLKVVPEDHGTGFTTEVSQVLDHPDQSNSFRSLALFPPCF